MNRAAYRATIAIAWGNPTTRPPAHAETLEDGRTIWSCTILDRAIEENIKSEYAPQVPPGSGWCHWWTPIMDAPKRWSGDRKAAARRRNLRTRLEKAVPLFADQFEAAELARRPAYFDPAQIEADAAARAAP